MIIQTIELWPGRHDVRLTTFIHTPDHFFPVHNKRPAIIVCPGGGFSVCPKDGNEGDPVAMSFACDGYQAFVLEYSVINNSKKEDVLYPAQMYDLGKAVLTIREHADEWEIDTDRIVIVGFSAGAFVCAQYATTYHQGYLSRKLNTTKDQLKIAAAILVYGIYDYAAQIQYEEEHPAPDFLVKEDCSDYVFGTLHPTKQQLEENSPILNVSRFTPPLFLVTAIDDPAIPAVQTLDMARKCHEMNVPYEVHVFERGGHGFSLGRYSDDAYREDKALSCSAWVPMAKKFLNHKLAPETAQYEPDLAKLLESMKQN